MLFGGMHIQSFARSAECGQNLCQCHGSRLCVRFTTLINKRSWTLQGYLCLAIGQHGKPRSVRTDNEAIFNSFVFTTFLRLAGIRKQTTPVCAPWCNGRIERLFATIKPWLRQLVYQSNH